MGQIALARMFAQRRPGSYQRRIESRLCQAMRMKTGEVRWDHLLYNCRAVDPRPDGRGYAITESAAIGIAGHQIVFCGSMSELPFAAAQCAEHLHDLAGRMVTPGLIDCHTHLVFAGNRADEFELRLGGADYQQIARAGGGIASTVRATRAASDDELLAQSLVRARALLDDGVTCIEIKSGYGLNLDSERRMLQTARRLAAALGIEVQATFLGLHALPPEFSERRDAYVSAVIEDWLPALHAEGLVDAVDAFCEGIAFSADEVRRLFVKARSLGVPVKLHADQLSDLGGAALCAEFDGRSADHIEYSGPAAVAAMAEHGTVAVLLPGAFYCLRETTLPPINALRHAGVAMAVSTDLNPGTSPVCSLRMAMNQACTLFRLTPAETFAGVTIHAARALGLADRKGRLQCGFDADLAIWNMNSPAELSYWIGAPGPHSIWIAGRERR